MRDGIKALDDELLERIGGGELIKDKVEFYMGFIPIFKQVGLTKEQFLEAARKEWQDNPAKFSTNGSKEDFDQLMKKLYDEFDTYEWPE